jgi:hypothetical protein
VSESEPDEGSLLKILPLHFVQRQDDVFERVRLIEFLDNLAFISTRKMKKYTFREDGIYGKAF